MGELEELELKFCPGLVTNGHRENRRWAASQLSLWVNVTRGEFRKGSSGQTSERASAISAFEWPFTPMKASNL